MEITDLQIDLIQLNEIEITKLKRYLVKFLNSHENPTQDNALLYLNYILDLHRKGIRQMSPTDRKGTILRYGEISGNARLSNITNKRKTSLEGFIQRYGVDQGTFLFKEFQEKSKHTKQKYIDKYGTDLGLIKWEEYLKLKKDTSKWSIEYWKLNTPNKDSSTQRKDWLWSISPKNYKVWIKRGHCELEARHLAKQFCKVACDSVSLYKFLNKYGEELGQLKYIERLNKCNSSSFEFFLKKFDYDVDKANAAYIKSSKNIFKKNRVASKSSLKILIPLYKFFRSQEILRNDIFLGVNGSIEYCLVKYIQDKKRVYWYDFCIPSLKLIIEYNGSRWHTKTDHSIEDKEKWIKKHPFIKDKENWLSIYNQIHLEYEEKINFAKLNGFEVYIVWDTDNHFEFINKIVNIYENKINNKG